MIVIKKITVKYSPSEDRLCFATERASGDPLVFWLTARLATRLAACLVQKVELMASPADSKLESHIKQQAIQQWEQSAANLTQKAVPEVKLPPDTRQILIQSVDVGHTNKGFGLVFRWTKEDGAQVVLNPVEMRQFLQILYRTFKEACWSMDVWPDLYDQQEVSKKPPQAMFLH